MLAENTIITEISAYSACGVIGRPSRQLARHLNLPYYPRLAHAPELQLQNYFHVVRLF